MARHSDTPTNDDNHRSMPVSNSVASIQQLLGSQRADDIPAENTPESRILEGARPETVVLSEVRQTEEQFAGLYDQGDVLAPPEPGLERLLEMVQQSNIIPQCIEAIAVNQGGFGIDIEPTFPDPDNPPPGAEEQRERLESFLGTAPGGRTMEEVRGNKDRDRESIGNGYLEWLHTVGGDLAGVNHARGHTIRLCQMSDPVVVESTWMNPRTGVIHSVPRVQRFRRFAQINGVQRPVYFKELGDPRDMNKYTGRYAAEGEPIPLPLRATSMSHDLVYAAWTEYGWPRWAYQAPEVIGSREFAELVKRWFEQGAIGLWLIAASNGAVKNKEAVETALNKLRGATKAFGAVFVDAIAGDQDGWVREVGRPDKATNSVSVHDLQSKLDHNMVLQFMKTFRPIIRSAWRLPPTYTGEAGEYTKASVTVSQQVGEEQVFQPLRNSDDAFFNKRVLPMLGVWHWRMVTRGATTSDDIATAEATAAYLPMLTFAAVAKMVSNVAGIHMQVPEDEPWVHLPLEVLRARLTSGSDLDDPVSEGDMNSPEVIGKSALRGDRMYLGFLDVLQQATKP